jgi:hypothetical protein
MTRAVMAADRVDPVALKATLSVVAEKLQHNSAAYQRRNSAGWSDQTWLLSSLKGPGATRITAVEVLRQTGCVGWRRPLIPHEGRLSFATSSSDS